jgi:hypothetical protein
MRLWRAAGIAAIGLLAPLWCAPASAQGRDLGGGRRQCTDIYGYLDDPAPAGRAVHVAPNAASAVLGRIAPPWTDASGNSGPWAVSFRIKATQDGWLQVEGAGDDSELIGAPARPIYSGAGWIRGEGVSVGVQASQGFAAPRHSSAILVRTSHDGLDYVTAVVACDGNWVLAQWRENEFRRYRFDPRAVVRRKPLVLQAWVTGICNIQETSCDSLSGDRPER